MKRVGWLGVIGSGLLNGMGWGDWIEVGCLVGWAGVPQRMSNSQIGLILCS